MNDQSEIEGRAFLARNGAVATITLNRPDAYNAIDLAMARRLRDLAREVASDPDVRAVVVKGAGSAFCGGGDIRYFVSNLAEIDASIRALLDAYHEFLTQLALMPKVTIACVQGPAAGAGMSLATMCDLCIASEDARFTPAYAKLGVSPDGGGTYGLPRAVGARRALHVLLAEGSFSASQALAWGLATSVVPAADLEAETSRYAQRIAAHSPEVVANTKRLLRETATASLHDHLNNERESLLQCMATPTFAAAIDKFVHKA